MAALFWLCRNLIAVRLTAAVKHEFDQKLEAIKAELARKNGELESLRSTVIQAMSGNQAHLSTRRLAAIDQVIRSVQALKENTMLVQILAVLKLEYLAKHAGDTKVARFLDTIARPQEAVLESLARSREAELSRPFISPWAWALYSAFSGVITHEIARMGDHREPSDVFRRPYPSHAYGGEYFTSRHLIRTRALASVAPGAERTPGASPGNCKLPGCGLWSYPGDSLKV